MAIKRRNAEEATVTETPNTHSENKTKKPIWKKWWFWALVLVIVASIGNSSEDTTQKSETVVESEQENDTTQQTETVMESEPESEPTPQPETTVDNKPESEPTETTEKEQTSECIGKNIDDIDAHFRVSKVRNDVTGNWRISSIDESINMEEYALSYYKKYFSNDTEIHAIVNSSYNTTTQISVVFNTLNVSIYEYVDGEEHDAKLLFSGMLLKQYSVNMDTGEIEEIY